MTRCNLLVTLFQIVAVDVDLLFCYMCRHYEDLYRMDNYFNLICKSECKHINCQWATNSLVITTVEDGGIVSAWY